MTIAARINTLVIGSALCLVILLMALLVHLEYTAALERLERDLPVLVRSEPALPVALYQDDEQRLATAAEGLLDLPGVVTVAIHDAAGTVQARRDRPRGGGGRLPAFGAVRGDVLDSEPSRVALDAKEKPVGDGWLRALLDGRRRSHLTAPIFAGLNPLDKGLTRDQFGAAMLKPEGEASYFVIGYLHLATSGRALLSDLGPDLALAGALCAVLVLLCGVASVRLTRKVTAPLSRLAEAADEMAAGRLKQPVDIQGGGEIRDIAHILNGMIGGLSTYKTQMDTDHHLLSMKVEERTAQLSRRNEELNKAIEEVTETKNRMRQMAYYDSLTALPNRRLFSEQLDLLLKLGRRDGEQLALLFLDLDNFKRINDSLGHNAGDQLLRAVATRLSGCVRESDLVAFDSDSGPSIDVSRLGGDEFTVVLNRIDSSDSVAAVARRLLDELVAPIQIDGHELVITPSIGIAISPGDAEDVEGLLKAADTAMYHAKAMGKNNFVFYRSDMDPPGIERLRLETDLRKAVERDELVLHYQPQIDTRNGTVVGAEALLRWQHPEHGLVPPNDFITLAEEMGLIGDLGDWALGEACRQLKAFRADGLKLPKVTVNVSAMQFNPHFVATVRSVLEETGLPPSALQLELTEGVVMNDASFTVNALMDLKELGVTLSVDDFGTGYSSLAYLSRLPLDELKIDRSFVIKSHESENDANVVIAVIALARSLELQLVAEGVETRDQYAFLTDNGAHVIQGYLFSPPVTADALRPLLAPWHFMRQIQELADESSAGGDRQVG
jgi:diguanylate cyclase (GGDEF)-like protein